MQNSVSHSWKPAPTHQPAQSQRNRLLADQLEHQYQSRGKTIPPEHIQWMAQVRGQQLPQKVRAVVDLITARRRLTDTAFLKSPKYRTQQTRADRTGCHPDILEFETALIGECRKQGIPMFCHTAYRTPQEQLRVSSEGYSNLSGLYAPHPLGCAVDVIHSVLPWELSEDDREQRILWSIIGHIGEDTAYRKGIEVEWGGHWRSPWDPAHWQLKGWRQIVSDNVLAA